MALATYEDSSNNELSEERKKNQHLHYLLSTLETRKSETNETADNNVNALEQTYTKALADYQAMQGKLETQKTNIRVSQLRTRLEEKETKASASLLTLKKYKEEIARQSSFANGRQLTACLAEFEEKDLSKDIEEGRITHSTNKMDVKRLEDEIKEKTQLQGVSDVEYSNLKQKIKRSEGKSTMLEAEQQRLATSKEKILMTEEFLVNAVKDYTEKNEMQKGEIQELNEDIAEKRKGIDSLNRVAQKVKNEIGYDASDLGAVLSSPYVSNDYDSSKEELTMLRKKLDALVLKHKELTA